MCLTPILKVSKIMDNACYTLFYAYNLSLAKQKDQMKRSYYYNSNINAYLHNYKFNLNSRSKSHTDAKWRSDMYTFDTTNASNHIVRHKILDNTVRNYFDLFYENHTKIKVEDSFKKNSTSEFFLSTPCVKHNNDKVIVNIYGFDREKQVLESSISLQISQLAGDLNKKHNKFLNSNIYSKTPQSKQSLNIINIHETLREPKLKYYFYKYVLSCLGINITTHKKLIKKQGSEHHSEEYYVLKIAVNELGYKNSFNIIINLFKHASNFYDKIICNEEKYTLCFLFKVSKYNNSLHKSSGKVMYKIIFLLNYIMQGFVTCLYFSNQEREISFTKKINFAENLFLFYMCYNSLAKQNKLIYLLLTDIFRFNLKLNKISTYFSNLKNILIKIYGNSVYLNFTQLKYPYMSSDIAAEALAIKLKDRTRKLFRIMNAFTDMISLPLYNKLDFANVHNKNIKNPVILYKHRDDNRKIEFNTLNHLKFKWVTGIWIEARGRLTNRYSISRSVYFLKNKGNLKNLESVYGFHSIGNTHKMNIQHSYYQSKRRIGAFGIKTRINNN